MTANHDNTMNNADGSACGKFQANIAAVIQIR
jgi:hypothetical protein